jgi:GNAT superfamily N-acetyltransferase
VPFHIKPFEACYVEEASALLLKQYERERQCVRSLPSPNNLLLPKLVDHIKSISGNAGVGAFSNGRLIGFMLTGGFFSFKSQPAVIIPEFAHASIEENKSDIYQRLYMSISAQWNTNQPTLHIFGHFAHDKILQETLYLLGFGAILAERIRDLSPLENETNDSIELEMDPEKLVLLDQEHRAFYPASPTFIWKDTDPDTVLQDLRETCSAGTVFLVYRKEGIPAGYFSVGESALGAEGFLLQNTNSAQIKSAFIKPDLRSRGIGACLLKESIAWATINGFERLFVEHETANYYGSRFWSKYFQEYLYFSMRYIDPIVLK